MKTHLTLAFSLLLIGTGAALAQTPDGETPAEETVCDNETGAAFGLCNAYCEAMDCESDDPQASEAACGKVRDKFMQITGRDLPCEAPPATCPCLSIPMFQRVLEQDGELMCGSFDPNVGVGLQVASSGTVFILSAGIPSDPVTQCSIYDDFFGRATSLTITGQEAAACEQLFRDRIASLGRTCP